MRIVLAVIFLLNCTLLQAEAVKNQWIVKFKDPAKMADFIDSDKGDLKRINDNFALYKGKKVEIFADDDNIEYIQPNFIYKAYNFDSDDPLLNKQWSKSKIEIGKAWEYTTGNSNIVVAVIDTGVDYKHEDLKDNIWRNPGEIPDNNIDDDNNGYIDDVIGWDFNEDDNDPMDETGSIFRGENPGHGTHCAGNMGAVGNNGIGISGVVPQVSIMPLRFLGKNGQGTTEMAIKAIEYAIANGAHILNNSWGSKGQEQQFDNALSDLIQKCLDKDILFIAAAGNHSVNNDTSPEAAYPASYPHANIISVAASTNSDGLASFSCYGKTTVDLAAPGTAIYSTVPNNRYESAIIPIFAQWDGTSMAAPQVSGVAALIKSARPELTFSEIKTILLDSSDKLEAFQGRTLSGGRLNAYKALKMALER